MDLEKLTKHQIVLLTLLISFVSSIATAIITVTLMEQAPTNVVRTINKIVERTVETIVPEDGATETTTVIEERIVHVSDSERVADVVEEVLEGFVRIYDTDNELIGVGAIEERKGIVTASNVLDLGRYTANFPGDSEEERYLVSVASIDEETGLTEFSYDFDDRERADIDFIYQGNDELDPPLFKDSEYGGLETINVGRLRIGQEVLVLGGVDHNKIERGIITAKYFPEGGNRFKIETSLDGQDFVEGAVLFTLSGEVIGYGTRKGGDYMFVATVASNDPYAEETTEGNAAANVLDAVETVD